MDSIDDEIIEDEPLIHNIPTDTNQTTLMEALKTLSGKIRRNLESKNIQTSNTDGLTTLADKILEIKQDFTNIIYYNKQINPTNYTIISWDNTQNWQLKCQALIEYDFGGIDLYLDSKTIRIYKAEYLEAYCIEPTDEEKYISQIPLTNTINLEIRKTPNNLEITIKTPTITDTKTITIENTEEISITTSNNTELNNILIQNV